MKCTTGARATCGEVRPTCSGCDGCGFSGRGTCYSDVCDGCGGLGSPGPSCAPTCADVPAPAIDGVRAGLLGLLARRVEREVIDRCDGYRLPNIIAAHFRIGSDRAPALPKLGPCPEVRVFRPCACGHSTHDHDADDGYGGCYECSCTRWQGPPRAVETTLRTDAACNDNCICGAEHEPGLDYFVSMFSNSGSRQAMLLGPYSTHSFALSMVDVARHIADRENPWQAMRAWFGTCSMPSGSGIVGKLNDMLAEGEACAAAKAEAEPSAKKRRRSVKVVLVAESHTPGDKRSK